MGGEHGHIPRGVSNDEELGEGSVVIRGGGGGCGGR